MSPYDLKVRSLSVVMPAFNEEEAIDGVLDDLNRVLKASTLEAFEIIVVDDGSADGTAERVKEHSDVLIFSHSRNLGYGAALKTGIARASHNWICIVDADGSYPIERIRDLLSAAPGVDMVVGARTAEDVQYPFIRRIPKIFLRRFAEWIAQAKIEDLNSGLRLFRRDVAQRVVHLLPDGFSFTTTITLALMTNLYTVRFIPIGYSVRIGRSKIRPIRDTLNFVLLIMRSGVYFAPFRIFMPVSAVLFIAFVTSAMYDILVIKNIGDKTLILLTLCMNVGLFALLADMIHQRLGR